MINEVSTGNCVINSCAKDFSSVRVNGGKPRRMDSVSFGVDIVKDVFSDSFDTTDSLFVESNRVVFGN
jgi:hypothetical protein